jgi:predicted nuclease with TOPRIM domain
VDPKDATPWGLALLLLTTLAAAGQALWRQVVQQPRLDLREQMAALKTEHHEERRQLLEQISQLQNEAKLQQREYLKLGFEHAKLSAKYERLRGVSSVPPST